jgi:hypothetical protein
LDEDVLEAVARLKLPDEQHHDSSSMDAKVDNIKDMT